MPIDEELEKELNELFRDVLDTDDRKFERIYEIVELKFWPKAMVYTYSDKVVADVLMFKFWCKIITKLPLIKNNWMGSGAYLSKMLRNIAIDHSRVDHPEETVRIVEFSQNKDLRNEVLNFVDEKFCLNDKQKTILDKVLNIISAMPKRKQQVIHLYFFMQLSIGEIAAILGIEKVGTARTIKNRAIKDIREALNMDINLPSLKDLL